MKIFLNLLPPERKGSIIRQFYWRFFLGQGFIVFLISLVVVFVMGALYLRVYFEGRWEQLEDISQASTEQQAQYSRYEEKFEATNRTARSTAGFLTLHTSFSELLRHIENVMPANTKIEKISTQSYKVFLTGTADTRDTFLALQENIKSDSCFESLTTPLSNLFSETNVQFEIDFTIKPECLRGSTPKI